MLYSLTYTIVRLHWAVFAADSVADVRHNLASPKLLGKSVQDGKMSLSDLLDTLNKSVVDQVKAALDHMQVNSFFPTIRELNLLN